VTVLYVASGTQMFRLQADDEGGAARNHLPVDLHRYRYLAAQWLRFATVGAANTLLSWCAYAVLVRLGLHYLLASGLAFALGVVNSYALNRRWTFRSEDRRAPEALRFVAVQGIGLGFDVGLLYTLVHDVRLQHLLAQALVFPPASTLTFLLSRQWAFAGARLDPAR
jgi:putative flippase GtrA